MKIVNLAKTVLVITVLLAGMSSCHDKYYEDYRNTDEKLCNKDWMLDIESADNSTEWYRYIYEFYENGKMEKTELHFRNGENKAYNTQIWHDLNWTWADNSRERIILGDKGNYTYFDNVMVRDHYLSGVLDGEYVTFTDSKYK